MGNQTSQSLCPPDIFGKCPRVQGEKVAIELTTAKAYVQRLAKAGYLACIQAGRGGKPSTWKLKPAMNTGPLPPMILRSDLVFDQNREAVIGTLEAREVAP